MSIINVLRDSHILDPIDLKSNVQRRLSLLRFHVWFQISHMHKLYITFHKNARPLFAPIWNRAVQLGVLQVGYTDTLHRGQYIASWGKVVSPFENTILELTLIFFARYSIR